MHLSLSTYVFCSFLEPAELFLQATGRAPFSSYI